ncbi:uncharacterized protein LOC124775705 [Schistocerca piceifrons]|uniref:uncharacterized protein LOC124775705 n=1 Tax=Schistocerca piceifrons TaxID=274613 RepID=UPI001F5E86A3|nr:uncharacterized protein LOC124775705 [Schistocerca piceifrons]
MSMACSARSESSSALSPELRTSSGSPTTCTPPPRPLTAAALTTVRCRCCKGTAGPKAGSRSGASAEGAPPAPAAAAARGPGLRLRLWLGGGLSSRSLCGGDGDPSSELLEGGGGGEGGRVAVASAPGAGNCTRRGDRSDDLSGPPVYTREYASPAGVCVTCATHLALTIRSC